MSSKRSVSVCSRSPKFYSENQNSRLLFSSTCSTTSHISKSPFETAIYSQDDIQGSSAILAAELDKLILVNAGLTKEIGTWKRKYKECYRLLEHHLPTDNENEGNSEYKQKYEKLKGKANELKKGFKTLENIVIEKNQEIESWSLKYSQMEQEYIDQIQNLRNQIEIVLKTQIEKEVTLAFSAFEKEKASREEDWADLITKLNQSQVELRFVSEEKEQALRKLEEVKGKLEGVSSMEKEYKTLNEGYEKAVRQLDEVREQLAAKEVNCKSIQNKCTMMSGEIDKLRNSVKEQTTKCVVAQKELNCLSEEKEKIGKELEQVREQLKIVEKNYKDAQCKYILRSEEAERLKSGEGERDARVGKLSEELVMLNREQERMVGELEDVKAELIIEQDKNSQLKTKMEEKNKRIEEIEENLMMLREEKDRTVRELEEVRQQLVISEEKQENKMKSVESLYRNEKEKMKHEISELQEMVEVKEKAIIRLEEEMRVKESQQRVYQDKVLAQQGELIIEQDQNSQLKEKMEEKNRRIEGIEESLVVLREEKDRTVRELEEMRQQLAISEEKQENKMKSVEILYQNEKEKMKHEILELQELVEAKEKAIISLEGEMRVKESQQRVYQDKVLAQQGELQLMQDNILMLNQEIALGKTAQTLHTCELRRRDEALESVKNNLKGEVEQKERLEQEVMRLEMEKSKVTKEKEALVEENLALFCLRDKVREHEETLKALRKEKSDLKARLEMTEKESIESLKNSDKSIEQYEKRIQALIERNGALAGEMEELKLRVEEFSLEMEGKEDLKIRLVKNEIFLQEMMRLLGVDSDKIVGKIEEILKEIARLSKENVSLKSSLGQGEESRGVLEGRLKDLEASWEQLKVCLGEEKAEEMVKKIEGYKREMKRVNCEAGVLKKRYEDQEMKNIQEIDRVRCETENMWKKRMEAEVESKKLIIRHMEEEMAKERSEHESRVESEMKRNEDYEKQIKDLVEKNEKANARVSQLAQEIEASKLNFEEEKVMESRLTGLKFELEKERRAQQEKEFASIENQWKEKVSFHEGQAKNWKGKVEDFEMRQVLYFIEIERLFGINAGLIADVNKLTLELRDSSMELEKNRKMLLEATKIETARSDQRDQFDEVARDLTKQIEGLERKFQSHFKEKEQDDGLAMETPVKEISRFGERRSKRGQYSSIHKSHAELRDLAMKFESEKKTMENQLAQLKKIVDMNKSEMKRMNQDNMLQDLNNQRSPSIKFGDDQSRPSYLGSDIRPKSPFQSHNGSQFYTSAGKENVKNIPSLSLTKSASHSVLGFKNGSLQREDDSSLYPKVSVFKY